ncbi:MAG: hypothetical protein JWL70_2984 [Acidimicrobiia bacterium]|nr:hypothetical protein [Acidimicrobiia bacterium]
MIPQLPGVITADEVRQTAGTIARLQRSDGMIPWFSGGHCDPWNHVETAMALDVAGFETEATLAYEWLRNTQRADGSWFNYYIGDTVEAHGVEDHKLDTNVIAYVATGVWHHYRLTENRAFLERFFPVVERAIEFVLGLQSPRGEIIWACHCDAKPWSYALLTGSSSICLSIRCACALARALGDDRPEWELAAMNLASVIRNVPDAFEPKTRWAMDWYYPVLSGALTTDESTTRLLDHYDTFVMGGRGVRCVSDEPWVTAAETAECALAHLVAGDPDSALELLSCTRRHRRDDGSYWTGLVHPGAVPFPDQESSAYTAAAVILVADAITGASAASDLFLGADLPAVVDGVDSPVAEP